LTDFSIDDVLAMELDLTTARVGLLQPCNDAQECRLSRSRWPQERQQRAISDVQADAIEGLEGTEGLVDVINLNAHDSGSSPGVLEAKLLEAWRMSRSIFHSTTVFTMSVTTASMARSDAMAKA